MMKVLKLALAAAALIGGMATTAFADDTVKDAVKARRGYYQLAKLNFSGLVGMAKGKVTYDAGVAHVLATNLQIIASMNPAPLYPKGSDNEALFGDTRALPKIWTDGGGAATKHEAFAKAAAALAEAAPKGLDTLRGALGPVADSCKGCHKAYRAESF